MTAPCHVLLTGATGLVGARIYRYLPPAVRVTALIHSRQGPDESRPGATLRRVDLARSGAGRGIVEELAPDVVIHCAALSRLGECERSAAAAWQLNVEATDEIARACRRRGAWLLHFSTDQVFDGEAAPYGEEDRPAPLTEYGCSKAAAEQRVLEADPTALVVRCALVLGPAPDDRSGALDFLRDAARRELEVRAFSDEVRTPISVLDLCRVIGVLVERRPAGLLHLAGPEALDRHALGLRVREAFELEGLRLVPASRTEADHPRPRDLSMHTARARTLGLPECRPVAEALTELAALLREGRVPHDLQTSQ